jgi:inner membrane protein
MGWRPYLVSLAGVVSHLALDLTNVYGVRLLLPFSPRWLRLDITNVVDPWIWLALLMAVIAPALAGLIGSEIGDTRKPGRLAATLALLFLALYDGGRAILHQRAVETLDSRVYGAPVRRVAAFPSASNPLVWRGLVELADSSYLLFPMHLRDPFDPDAARRLYSAADTAPAAAARQTIVFQDFLAFSQFPYWMTTPVAEPSGGSRVDVADLRFGDPPSRGFTASALLDDRRRVVRAWFRFL